MSTSRRKFLRAGLLATLCATLPAKTIFSQKGKDVAPGAQPPRLADPLANYTKASFESYLNSIFQLQTVYGTIEVTLVRIDDMPAPNGGECFSLLFRGGSRELPQDTYTLDHPALGSFQLLIVPSGADANGAQSYVATINRLSYADALNAGAPAIGAPATNSRPSTKPAPKPAPPRNNPAGSPSPVRKKPSTMDFDRDNFRFFENSPR